MSCHQWVLSVIHYACDKTATPIPEALRIPPHLAWADRLNYAAQQVASELTSSLIALSPPNHYKLERIRVLSPYSFFSPLQSVPENNGPLNFIKERCSIM